MVGTVGALTFAQHWSNTFVQFAPKLRNGGFRVVGPMKVQHMLAVWKSGLVHSPCVKLDMFNNFVTPLTVTVMFEAVLYGESPKLGVLGVLS